MFKLCSPNLLVPEFCIIIVLNALSRYVAMNLLVRLNICNQAHSCGTAFSGSGIEVSENTTYRTPADHLSDWQW